MECFKVFHIQTSWSKLQQLLNLRTAVMRSNYLLTKVKIRHPAKIMAQKVSEITGEL